MLFKDRAEWRKVDAVLERSEFIDQMVAAQLSPEERGRAVVYLREGSYAKGDEISFPGIVQQAPWDAWLAFVDQDPTANWGHRSRYLLVDEVTGESLSFDARFPPFRRDQAQGWRICYRAGGVPDAALLIPP